jgi:hypothetical protein
MAPEDLRRQDRLTRPGVSAARPQSPLFRTGRWVALVLLGGLLGGLLMGLTAASIASDKSLSGEARSVDATSGETQSGDAIHREVARGPSNVENARAHDDTGAHTGSRVWVRALPGANRPAASSTE